MDREEDNFITGDYRPYVPEGKYEAICFDYSFWKYITPGQGNRPFIHPKLTLLFRLIGRGVEDVVLPMYFAMPYEGQPIPPGSKYYLTWTIANNGKRPSRNAKVSPRIFLNKAYMVKVKTKKPNNSGEEVPDSLSYSAVEAIVRVIDKDNEG
jgi:hypothetical protein